MKCKFYSEYIDDEEQIKNMKEMLGWEVKNL